MKPRNKFEKTVLAQSGKLRPLTKAQLSWAFRECVSHFAHRLPKGRTTCMDCGHSWQMEQHKEQHMEHCVCPKCKAKLEVRQTYVRKVKQKSYFTVLAKCGEYQTLRMFLLVVEMEKGCRHAHTPLKSDSIGGTPRANKPLSPFSAYWVGIWTLFLSARRLPFGVTMMFTATSHLLTLAQSTPPSTPCKETVSAATCKTLNRQGLYRHC